MDDFIVHAQDAINTLITPTPDEPTRTNALNIVCAALHSFPVIRSHLVDSFADGECQITISTQLCQLVDCLITECGEGGDYDSCIRIATRLGSPLLNKLIIAKTGSAIGALWLVWASIASGIDQSDTLIDSLQHKIANAAYSQCKEVISRLKAMLHLLSSSGSQMLASCLDCLETPPVATMPKTDYTKTVVPSNSEDILYYLRHEPEFSCLEFEAKMAAWRLKWPSKKENDILWMAIWTALLRLNRPGLIEGIIGIVKANVDVLGLPTLAETYRDLLLRASTSEPISSSFFGTLLSQHKGLKAAGPAEAWSPVVYIATKLVLACGLGPLWDNVFDESICDCFGTSDILPDVTILLAVSIHKELKQHAPLLVKRLTFLAARPTPDPHIESLHLLLGKSQPTFQQWLRWELDQPSCDDAQYYFAAYQYLKSVPSDEWIKHLFVGLCCGKSMPQQLMSIFRDGCLSIGCHWLIAAVNSIPQGSTMIRVLEAIPSAVTCELNGPLPRNKAIVGHLLRLLLSSVDCSSATQLKIRLEKELNPFRLEIASWLQNGLASQLLGSASRHAPGWVAWLKTLDTSVPKLKSIRTRPSINMLLASLRSQCQLLRYDGAVWLWTGSEQRLSPQPVLVDPPSPIVLPHAPANEWEAEPIISDKAHRHVPKPVKRKLPAPTPKRVVKPKQDWDRVVESVVMDVQASHDAYDDGDDGVLLL